MAATVRRAAIRVECLGVEVDRLVAEAPPAVDVERRETAAELVEQVGQLAIGEHVLAVDPLLKRCRRIQLGE